MRTLKEIQADIDDLKKDKKEIAKWDGTDSVEYAEILEELETLQDEYDFVSLHGG